jgi:predicted dehydrogenase
MPTADRRTFIKATAVATAAGVVGGAYAGGSDEMRVGVIGCGGRGSGAAEDVLNSAKGVKIVALGDVFKDKVYTLRERLNGFIQRDGPAKEFGNSVDVRDEQCFDGLDAFEKVIASDVNYVMLCTPPGFRPAHLRAAVAAGKNIFTEKPVGVDGPGLRQVLALVDEVNKKGLAVGAGTQRRHQTAYLKVMKQVHDGVIGDIVALRGYWNGQGIWFRPRQPGMSDLAYQLHNWYHFLWICGDHIVEQHVHNLDVCNWAMRSHPVRCDGIGGRVGNHASRPNGPPAEVGNIFDNFSVDYVYSVGGRDVHMYSSCRHIPETKTNVSEAIVGTRGTVQTADATFYRVNGVNLPLTPEEREQDKKKYVTEHTAFIESIRAGKPLNELGNVAESTLTAIMGRMSAYTGRPVTWDQALNSQENTFPEKLDWEGAMPMPPVPIPGKSKLT